MFYRLGLRSEIVLQLFLLMSASIVFISLLITKASEQELLQQRIISNTSLLQLLEDNLELKKQPAKDIDLLLQKSLERFHEQHGLEALAVLGPDQETVKSMNGELPGWPDRKEGRIAALSRNMSTKVRYQGALLNFLVPAKNYLLVTLPLKSSSNRTESFQAYFSLDDIPSRVFKAHSYMLPYIFFVGLTLVLFGSYLLGKIVVRPIKLMQQASQNIASGNLEQTLPSSGPKEIYQLMDHFNKMSDNLQKSRRESEAHIHSLKQINQELEQTRNELVQSEKMASIGHLAAGIAHEIGNPLGALLGYLELLTQQQDPALAKDIVDRSLDETKRIDQLVRDLLDYARPENGDQAGCDPVQIIQETISLLEQQASLLSDRLILHLAEILPQVPISARKLQQVLINLLINARDASPDQGEIVLLAETWGEMVRVTVRDSGEGVPEENLPYLFDPFFTTKPQGQGRGLGLFIAHRIISDAGGKIEVESAAKGTRFTVLLPTRESSTDET